MLTNLFEFATHGIFAMRCVFVFKGEYGGFCIALFKPKRALYQCLQLAHMRLSDLIESH